LGERERGFGNASKQQGATFRSRDGRFGGDEREEKLESRFESRFLAWTGPRRRCLTYRPGTAASRDLNNNFCIIFCFFVLFSK
jgi:hypothetical protein